MPNHNEHIHILKGWKSLQEYSEYLCNIIGMDTIIELTTSAIGFLT